ncbi:hypothetical protein AVEN_99622-1 [Araneus ventricosus]|uniref:Uncharacterized protein n=1 Tax=Araneus ventricosus TaxID=182803 RepID=A0A4Y2NIQ8_ARAVE|nr:hypothetical protein AVEN_233487-1 [Araneus ventricosus]GBN39471.1 hypothetical protein AVEN_99622-1 [Araneus ventricosus]
MKMKLGFVMSVENRNNSQWSEGTQSPTKNSKQRCQHTKSCALCSGTDRAFCLSSSFPEVKPSMWYNTVKHCKNCGVQFKTKGDIYSVKALCCFMTTHIPILLVSLKTLFNNLVGSSSISITRSTAPTSHLKDNHLFLNLKHDFGGRSFDSDDDAKNGVQQWLSSLAASYFEEGIDKLVSCYDKCLNNGGNYVEK